MGSELKYLAVLAITVAAFLHSTAAQETHIVGDEFGWIVPPGGHYAYELWASGHKFSVGDILEFKFTTGEQDVAKVTKEAFDSCNSTSPIELKTTGPANFSLNTIGEYYFIGTMDKRCELGQKLAINVTANSGGPSASPAPAPTARGPVTYIVGEQLGWFVPGQYAYSAWANGKTFIVGDTLVFNFINETQDVAVVTKAAFDNCTTNSTIAVYTDSPVYIVLNTTGEHYFTSTYDRHCELGQKLAINVIAKSTKTATSPSSPTTPSSQAPSAHSPAASAPLNSAAPSTIIGRGYFFTFLLVGMAFFH
ncbi:blue copper protein-like [Argentina anserina]|uniref:blue copper protein-like n=1 Tax=Argentina anserina TaxID=57926 RepID=UPI0021762164|nr:blue copper protein-like [Potentilla anserina]